MRAPVRTVGVVTASVNTRPVAVGRRTPSVAAAFMLAIAGNILVALILALALGAFVLAAAAVFGGGLLAVV